MTRRHAAFLPSVILFAAIVAISASNFLHAATESTASGKTVAAPEGAGASRHSFLDPVNDFVRDDILRPVAPFQLVPEKDPNAWAFSLEPYMWLTAISGTSGVGDLPALDINASAKSLLQNLNWGIMSKGEARKGRWGILADGYYASLSASGDLGGTFYKSGTLDMQQAFVSLALAYRVIDDRRGFLDVYAGARYNYLGIQVDTSLDSEGIQTLSDKLTERLAAGISTRVEHVVVEIAQLTEPERRTRVEHAVTKLLSLENPVFARYAAAQVAVDIAKAKGQETAALESQAAAAKKSLSKKLAKTIKDNLPTHGAGDQWWVDPIVGLRGQVNFTRWLFLAAQSDVGGFGVGSQITWNVQATVGVNFTRNIFGELGYRYMYVDYDKNAFLYNMNSYGIYSGLGFKF